MGTKKLHQLYKNAEPQTKEDKLLVEKYQKAIAKKLKDPQFAKKAAMIIEKMLNEKIK